MRPALLALTRAVSPLLESGERSHVERAPIDASRAADQHAAYERVLAGLGCSVRRVAPAPDLPDSVFIEDTAVVVPEVAVLTRPGAGSRRPELDGVAEALARWRPVRRIRPPGTLDGGDVLRIGRDVHVGASVRSNEAGADQLRAILGPFGYRVHRVEVRGCLHLKTAVTEAADGLLVVNPAWLPAVAFAGHDRIEVDPGEPFAANVLRIGASVVMPASQPATRRRLESRGLEVVTVDVSELARAEGGVTCCSVLIEHGFPGAEAPS